MLQEEIQKRWRGREEIHEKIWEGGGDFSCLPVSLIFPLFISPPKHQNKNSTTPPMILVPGQPQQPRPHPSSIAGKPTTSPQQSALHLQNHSTNQRNPCSYGPTNGLIKPPHHLHRTESPLKAPTNIWVEPLSPDPHRLVKPPISTTIPLVAISTTQSPHHHRLSGASKPPPRSIRKSSKGSSSCGVPVIVEWNCQKNNNNKEGKEGYKGFSV